jgi:iron complex outermembrane receptor protein
MSVTLRSGLLAATATLGLMAGVAHAQDNTTDKTSKTGDKDIPVVVVTADKSAKSIQKTSIAVSVVSGQEIQSQGRTKMDDVLMNQPATVVQGAAKGFMVSIRGLGMNLPPQMGQGAVSINYDGAYTSRAENSAAGFYDLDRVEVLRGPQATLYGRNAVGGVLNVISRDPSLKGLNGYVAAEIGDYSLGHLEGAINVPLSDQFAVRASGSAIDRKGYLSNGHDDNVAQAGRVKLLYQPNDDVKLVVGAEHTHLGGKGPGGVPLAAGQQEPSNWDTTDVAFGKQDVNADKVWATFTANIGPGVLFIEPSRQETKGTQLGAFGGNFANSSDPKLTRQNAIEVRYSSPASSRTQWNIGFYHYDNLNIQQTISGACEDTAGNYVVPPAGYNAAPPGPPGPAAPGACYDSTSWVATNYSPETRKSVTDAIFGQITQPLSNSFRLIAGLRYSKERLRGVNDANETTTDLSVSWVELARVDDNHVDYRLGFEKDLAPNSMLYGVIASGYRQGGYSFDLSPYAPEKMTDYEVGVKNRFMDGRVQFNADAFFYDYKAFQLVIANFAASPPQIYVPTMPAREYGLEMEGQALLGDRGHLSGSLVLLDSKLDGKDGFFVDAPFPNSPKISVKVSYSYDISLSSGTLTPRIDLRSLSSQVVYPDEKIPNDIRDVQKGYSTGDASVLYRPDDGSWTLNVYCKNLNNAKIKTSHFFGYAQLSAPRTYGLVLSRNF